MVLLVIIRLNVACCLEASRTEYNNPRAQCHFSHVYTQCSNTFMKKLNEWFRKKLNKFYDTEIQEDTE